MPNSGGRTPSYISPSALKTFEKDAADYYIKYLCPTRVPRMPQTEPMAVGSAFDAFVKSFLHHSLFGNFGPDDAYAKDRIFEEQVEPHVRDGAYAAGEYVFECYLKSGALSNMMIELNRAAGEPRFEFSIQGTVSGEVGEIPLLGRPDIFFINDQGARVIWDWKVNGFYGNSATSPNKGYTKCLDSWTSGKPRSRTHNAMHKDCIIKDHHGIKINGSQWMEDLNTDWADQLSIYGWLLGEEVGSENLIVGIDQIVSMGRDEPGKFPFLRIASFRNVVSSQYQFDLVDRLNFLWESIMTGHIFRDMSKEANDAKIRELDAEATELMKEDDFSKFMRTI